MPSFSPSSKGVCVPKGFSSAGIACGIKEPSSPKKDLALILSEVPCQAAGVFTRNKVSAAPIHLCKQHLQKGASSTARAILVNSGNANACTGKQGDEDARAMAELAAETVGCQSHQIFIASTGIIGIPLPLERIRNQVGSLQASLQTESSQDAAEAIMTSDTRPKIQALASENFSVGGIAKGAGMICPNMATMLAFVTTDAQITAEEADRMLRIAVDQSFNRI
ncbi:MAG: bifunctional ornithine acetyltransferase/N-acetylglutamate synthase, partial [Verrucomicrobiota bacterium]